MKNYPLFCFKCAKFLTLLKITKNKNFKTLHHAMTDNDHG